MSLADEIEAEIVAIGRPIVLRRVTGTRQVPIDVTVAAIVSGYQPQQLVGAVAEGDRQVIIGNATILRRKWPGPPRRNDKAIIDGVTVNVQDCDSLDVAGEIVRYNMHVRG